MKIKTLKIKVEKDNQEFDFNEFMDGSNIIHKTEASLQKEKDGHYWHVFMTYEPQIAKPYFIPTPKPKIILPEGFEDEINNYLYHNPSNNTRVKNTIKGNVEVLLGMRRIEDFKKLNKLGQNSLEKEASLFHGILNIIEKYRKK